MDQLLQQIGDAVGGVAANPVVGLVGAIAVGYLVIVWLASALWAFVDMRRRTDNPFVPYATASVVIIASPLLFPFALLLHMVIRPRTTVTEGRVSRLREAALGAEVDLPRCPNCRKPVEEDWLICPQCRSIIGHRCDHCGRSVGVDWDACAWCGVSFQPPPAAIRTDP